MSAPLPPVSYVVRSEQNKRENNEDSFDCFWFSPTLNGDPLTVMMVADGMGGHEHGEDVSREALLAMKSYLVQHISTHNRGELRLSVEGLQKILAGALAHTNFLVQYMVEDQGWQQAGSTLVAALVWRDALIAVNLGDSPLYHFQVHNQHLEQVTQDHSVTGILAAHRLITPEEALCHQYRGQLQYYLGCPYLPDEFPLYVRWLQPGDLVLLCSDGVSGLLSPAEIADTLAESSWSLEERAERLLEMALAKEETDNQTLILWECPPWAVTTPATSALDSAQVSL
ncbi:MAG: protein phosphatase 2C domain-containing protein [Thermostichales cyanobacterium DRC_bins_46]